MLIVAQILVKVLGLIYRVVIVNVKGFRKCRKPDIMHQVMKYMHLCLHYQVLVYHLLYQNQYLRELRQGIEKRHIGYLKQHSHFLQAFGLILSILLYVFSDWIAINVLDVKDTSLVLKVLAPAIVFVSASSVIRGYFGGLRRYEVNKCITNIRTAFKLYINYNTCIYGSRKPCTYNGSSTEMQQQQYL